MHKKKPDIKSPTTTIRKTPKCYTLRVESSHDTFIIVIQMVSQFKLLHIYTDHVHTHTYIHKYTSYTSMEALVCMNVGALRTRHTPGPTTSI